jgi:transcription antitermination factor NusG
MLTGRASEWYAVRVKSNRERSVAQGLRGKEFEVCLPLFSARRRRASNSKVAESPLFPGYLFCRFDASQRLPILTVPGVVHIVSFGQIPQPIEEREIAAVQTVLRSGLRVNPYPALPVGQKVQLEDGPLTGLSGVILAHRANETFVVSVTLLQRSIAVVVDPAWISPIRAISPMQQKRVCAP